jgi:hydrogenase-4 membrane subunit HyfE
MNNISTTILILLEWALIFLAYKITTGKTIKDAIFWYRLQCLTLAYATTTTAIIRSTDNSLVLFALIGILPLGLFWVIEALLMNATLYDPSLRLWQQFKAPSRQFQYKIERIWKNVEGVSSSNRIEVVVFAIFLSIAILITQLVSVQSSLPIYRIERVGLIVSLGLHLIGLYNMIVKRDVFSQVIGLLIMDHGLYLAIVKIVAVPVPANLFVLALYFYTLITAIILVLMLPRVSAATDTIDLDQIAKTSELTEVSKPLLITKEQPNDEI